jgi:hypothetical protein
MSLIKKLIMLLLCLTGYNGYAQLTETQGWFFLSHTQALTKKFDLLADAQLRSANRFDYLNTLLLRSAVNYNFNDKHAVALGYAYKRDWEHKAQGKAITTENRIYEQYLFNFKHHRTEFTLRARLEQRWIKEDDDVSFSQRSRAFISAQIPLIADTGFTRGLYTGIQNELFLNVHHKDRVNKHLFDQNRSYISIGYRWNKKIDTEIGYQYWYQKEMENDYRRNVIQIMVTTNF